MVEVRPQEGWNGDENMEANHSAVANNRWRAHNRARHLPHHRTRLELARDYRLIGYGRIGNCVGNCSLALLARTAG